MSALRKRVSPLLGRLLTVAVCFSTLVVDPPSRLSAEDSTDASESAESTDATGLEPPITASERNHWSFRPLRRPDSPESDGTDWPRTSLDRFVWRKLQENGLGPSSPANLVTLCRRIHLDLTGLPPTPEDTDRLVADPSPDAYERLVDRVLASPDYGPRWAQPWLDLARFAETDGFEHDKLRPEAWKYRDWVVRAWNEDLPYDQFVRWQIAGDVLHPGQPDATLATAFCLSGPDMPDINSQDERKHVLLNEITSTVGAVFLGLQFGCAQCHDHMYDPISQVDFYRLRAFFEPAIALKRDQTVTVFGALAASPDRLPSARMWIRGDWRRPGPPVAPDFPRIANLQEVRPSTESGDQPRADLAQWLTDPEQPLVTRVMVNRLWQAHFARGLAPAASDFGTLSAEPTHPELLDWLATELVRNDWSVKALQRQIVTSSVYRQASRLDPAAPERERQAWQETLQRDRDNRLWTRFPRRRLDAESVRDALYAVSGSLCRDMGGPGVRPPLPAELISTLLRDQWVASDRESDRLRRSIYIFARRNLRYPLLAAFDRPAADASCAERLPSTTAPQALQLLNSHDARHAARLLADRICSDLDLDAADRARVLVERAVRRAWGRRPDPAETRTLIAFLAERSTVWAAEGLSQVAAETEAATELCLALINASEFVFVD